MPRVKSPRRRRFAAAGAVTIGSLSVLVLLAAMGTADGDPTRPAAPGQTEGEAAETTLQAPAEAEAEAEAEAVSDTTPAATPTNPTETTSTAPAGQPPFPAPYQPAPNEVQPGAKRTGAAVVQQLTNYGMDSSPAELARNVTADPERARALTSATAAIHHPGMWSRGTIEYAQLGGHRDGAISIMVVVRQELGLDGATEPERSETRTMDVRLTVDAFGEWEFDQLASAGGQPVARPDDLSPLAASVVDDARIDLPDSAIWDIYSGHTHPALLRFMADLARQTPYAVAVLHTGHPHNVFGTDRLSNHTVGLAVDIYELGAVRVIDAHDVTSAIYLLTEQLAWRTDLRELGSPWLFEDALTRTFTNEVHHDHLHIGVSPDGQPAR
jgi:hypothetical protein